MRRNDAAIAVRRPSDLCETVALRTRRNRGWQAVSHARQHQSDADEALGVLLTIAHRLRVLAAAPWLRWRSQIPISDRFSEQFDASFVGNCLLGNGAIISNRRNSRVMHVKMDDDRHILARRDSLATVRGVRTRSADGEEAPYNMLLGNAILHLEARRIDNHSQ